ncbi:hypothetical protein LguiA_002407 [Lonicera macranthoides]
MSCLNFEYGERWLQEKIKRDSARLTQLEIERRIRLNKVPKERLKSQPRKFKFEGEWDSGVTNGRHGSDVGESRVRDNNMSSIKKKTSLNDPEEWHKLGKMMEAYIEFHMRGSEEPSPNASSYKSNHCKEEEKPTIYTPLSENKPKTDEIEEIEVMAEEGELWVEGVIPNLQEEADEEVLVQVEEPQVQALPAISVDENEFFAKPRDDVRAELKNDKVVEHIDFIGVDRFDVHPNFMLLDFFNKLRRIMLQYGLNFEEFCFVRRIKHGKVEILEGSIGVFKWGEAIESSKISKVVYEVTMPAMTQVKVSLLATKGSCDVPFSYNQVDTLTNGMIVGQTMNDVIYTGVNYYNYNYETEEEQLAACDLN